MLASLTAIRIVIPDEIGIEILRAPNPLTAYRNHLDTLHALDPKSITEYDVDNLRRGAITTLGKKALKDMGLTVPAERD